MQDASIEHPASLNQYTYHTYTFTTYKIVNYTANEDKTNVININRLTTPNNILDEALEWKTRPTKDQQTVAQNPDQRSLQYKNSQTEDGEVPAMIYNMLQPYPACGRPRTFVIPKRKIAVLNKKYHFLEHANKRSRCKREHGTGYTFFKFEKNVNATYVLLKIRIFFKTFIFSYNSK